MKKIAKKICSILVVVILLTGMLQAGVKKVEAADFTGTDVANYAKQFQGCGYVLGSSGPNMFDCVGLAVYVYAHFGINLPMGTSSYAGDACYKYGTKITDKWQLQPGDLILYGRSNNDVGHMAIYLGNGQVIHALNPGLGVRITYADYEMCKAYGDVNSGVWPNSDSVGSIQFGIRVLSSGGGSTSNSVENSYIFSHVRAENVTANSAKIVADYTNDTYGDVGFYFGTSPELAAMTKVSEYKYSNITTTTSSNNSYQVGVYYDDTYQYKWWTPLTPGTTYYYAFYCTKNGAEHISGIQSFTTVGGGESAFPLIDGEIYKIYSVLSGHVMEVSNGDNANGKRITLWPYGDVPWMQWKAVQHPDGYSFLNMSTGKALDISGGSAAERAALQQWDYCAADAQRFRLVDQGNGRYGMFARCSGLAVDVYGSFTDPGAQMEQYAFHGGDNQLWSFELIDKTAPVISNVRVTDVDSTGYTVLCDVTDNVGVARVTFPTWTEANGQDDLAQNWYDSCAVFRPVYGNTYTFRVNSADHNNEYGLYYTYIYAYDAAGNSVSEGSSTTL